MKRFFLLGLTAIAAVCAATGVYRSVAMSAARAKTVTATSTDSTFKMLKGASVRIKSDDVAANGLRFTAEMSAAYYDAARQLDDVSFGMFIMPYEYVSEYGDLTVENVGENGVYDWELSAEDGTMEYGSTGKTQILNVAYATLARDFGEDTAYYIRGSITNIKASNLEKAFIGRAYMRHKVGNAYEYVMADRANDGAENARSIYQVANAALQDDASGLTEAQKAFLTANYIEKVEEQYTEISTWEEFVDMSAGKYRLIKDIDLSDCPMMEQQLLLQHGLILAFSGVLDGNGHTVKNITIKGETDQALFGTLTGTIRNIAFQNVVIQGYKDSGKGCMYSERSALIYQMKDNALVENVQIDVKIKCSGAAYTESSDAAVKQNAGLVTYFIGGKIADVTMTFSSPKNDSVTDGAVAIFSSLGTASGEVQNTTLENVTVYAKSDQVKLYRLTSGVSEKLKSVTDCKVVVEETTSYSIVAVNKKFWYTTANVTPWKTTGRCLRTKRKKSAAL